jgi:hypothetical protein
VESIMSMCLDVTHFMKDIMNARKDLDALWDNEVRSELSTLLSHPVL